MTQQDFHFNAKTGELSRGGKVIMLRPLRAKLFAIVAAADGPLSQQVILDRVGVPMSKNPLRDEFRALNRKLALLHMKVETVLASHKSGRRLIVDAMPKWQPSIPPPVAIESSR